MTLQLDHVFICVEDLPSAERVLSGMGVHVGRRGTHNGQGTSNACAFFDNAYLELLCGANDVELQSEPVRPVSLWERMRWRDTGASPFGLAVRPGGAEEVPVETWSYEAPFLSPGTGIPILTPRFLHNEPLLFLSLVSQAPSEIPAERRPPLQHCGKNRRITGVTVHGSRLPRLSAALRYICEQGLLTLAPAAEPCLELEWDAGTSGQLLDCRPSLPLIIRH